ncbi:MAG: MlaD family protein [Myxococcota bacterium]
MSVVPRDAILGALWLCGLGLAAGMAIRAGSVSSVPNGIDVEVALPDAAGLVSGATVTMAGVVIGEVQTLGLRDGIAVAGLRIDSTSGATENATVRVRQRSLLGEKYLELQRQEGGAPLVQGSVLPDAPRQLEIDEALAALAPLLDDESGRGPAALLTTLVDLVENDPERLERMLHNADEVLQALRDEAPRMSSMMTRLDALVADGERTSRVIRRQAEAAGAPIRQAEATLKHADELMTDLEPSVVALDASMDDVQRLLEDLRTLSPQLVNVLDNLEEIDKWELRRLLREEGILIRVRPSEVEEKE